MVDLILRPKEQFVMLASIAAISLAISLTDWVQRGMHLSVNILLSSILAVICLYWLPMVLSYLGVQRFKLSNWPLQYTIFYCFMVLGCMSWGVLRSLLVNTQTFTLFEAAAIALPWSAGIFVATKFYLSQRHLKQEKQLRQLAEIRLLHSQLNPHFMFNSLNTISAFLKHHPETAGTLIHNLAAVLRYSLKHSVVTEEDAKRVTIADELVNLNQWVEIETCRFGENLSITFEVDESLINEEMPAMLLQPILENAIKHAKVNPLNIKVLIAAEGDEVLFEVRDNGVGFSGALLAQPEKAGLGLSITRSRLRLEASTELELSNEERSAGAVVRFRLKRNGQVC
ncbi:sensor histidine kinase [Pseudoalteromonas sp. J010]|uniref:sensor histidine kinase n=1 Tax=Pseudoalteromonas sp. J010 TaxID=998465 RepID=UPI000F64B75F|nr:histidine kinase [Pseudoalteromonas sp. J010]RRS06854.1 sensor histidine kinase [Pseudoalteromonas sp. J010]